MNEQFKFNASAMMVEEQASMKEPERKYGLTGPAVMGRYVCAYCGYHSSTALWDMNHECVYSEYQKHLSSLRKFPAHKSCREVWKDGDLIEEGKGFELQERECKTMGCGNSECILECMFPVYTAYPLPKEHAGNSWIQHIEQFGKLNELWNQIPEPTNTLFRQQIDIFAGKYPLPKEEGQEELWNEVVAKVAAAEIMKLSPSDVKGLTYWMEKVISELKQSYTLTKK